LALTINTGVDAFPRYNDEYLIDNYCSEETFHADIEKVVRRLKEFFAHAAEAEKIPHYIRENRNHSIITRLQAASGRWVRARETCGHRGG